METKMSDREVFLETHVTDAICNEFGLRYNDKMINQNERLNIFRLFQQNDLKDEGKLTVCRNTNLLCETIDLDAGNEKTCPLSDLVFI